MKKIIPILLLLSASTVNAQTFDVVPNPTSTGSFQILGAGGAASGYAGTPIALKNSLVLEYNASNVNQNYFAGTQTTLQLAVYKGGDSLHLIANPDNGLGVYFQNVQIVYKSKLYLGYINASGIVQLATFDGTSITLYPNPDASTNGEAGSFRIFRDSLYGLYLNAANVFQFAKVTPSGLSLIPNPDNSPYGFVKDYAVIFNDRICSRYVNAAGVAVLATYDGNSWTMWPNPDNTAYGYQPLFATAYHNKLYIQYYSSAGEFRLMQWDGTNNPTLIPNLQFLAQGGYVGSPIIYNDTLFFKYLSANSTNQLAKFDGTSITLVPNPDPYDWWNGFIGSPIIYNNNLYIEYETSDNKYHLAQYQTGSNSLEVFSNPDAASGYQGQPIVYNNNLYFQYLNASNTVQLGYLNGGNSLGLIANPAGVYDGIGFSSNGYGGYPYIWNNLLYMQYGSIPYGNAGNLVSFNGIALPVKLISFTATKQNNDALLQWSTAQEENSGYFNIQRSTDGKNFINIAKVSASGNSNSIRNYSYTDKNIASLTGSIVYYRLAETDKDAAITYSDVKTVDLGKQALQFSIYPNPANDFVSIVSSYDLANAVVIITDINGHALYEAKQNFSAGQQLKIPVSQFSDQVLMLTITCNKIRQQFKVVRQ